MTARKYCNINRHCLDWKVVRFREHGQPNEYGCVRPIHDDCESIEKRKREERKKAHSTGTEFQEDHIR